MPGLPCDVCQEDVYVLNGEVMDDANGQAYYRRYRVCINPKCGRYMHRRVTVEYYPEEREKPKVYKPSEVRRILRAMGKPPPPTLRLASGEVIPPLPWD